ncbi:MAG: metallophosphoesterase [Dehalococcoidia bacterium]|nr:metallophosphoesterase [Dehalococcoidia bacterium]
MRIKGQALIGVLCFLILVTSSACSATTKPPVFRYRYDESVQTVISKLPAQYPPTSFAVFSDPHVFAPELGMESPALDEYLANDRKLLRESTRIMKSVIGWVKETPARFVLVSGDLTKDGERVSHELCASYLREIEASGKQVYVVPGNHDILNPNAVSYSAAGSQPVRNITPGEFAEIYRAFGYGEALYRDSASLSYIVEPEKGLWLLALDANRYRENEGVNDAVTDGRFSPGTLRWIEEMLIKAHEQGKAVMVMMHHGVVEHYNGQEKYFGMYLVDDFQYISRLFAEYGARLVFTGHYHAQDITLKRFAGENKFLYDIETGSLVTYPCPYRNIEITADQKVHIRSGRVEAIKGYSGNFQDFAREYVTNGIVNIAVDTLKTFGIPADGAELLAEQVGNAFVAHYAGDEKLPAGQPVISAKGAGLRGWLVVFSRKGLLDGLWHDLAPPDNNITIDLNTGAWK